ncbi:vomeronasal type-1 receptor 94-like [Nannospalax galili]|uniref:vomeronasal type-1 receptor 94-like n=1 Tax=Nannospalax galili TaxID=1026970 RepID=UPI00081A1872|nr:vomeronasal type-1 receptor 94-like [Nannospalax galili]
MMNKKQLCTNTNIQNTFYTGVSIGISAKSILLLLYTFSFIHRHEHRLTDLPIWLLALFHLLMLLIDGIIATDIFMPKRHWNDITRKFLIYLYRFLRGFSICISCLVSVLQAITLSPRTSCLAKFKHNSSYYSMKHTFSTLWMFRETIFICLMVFSSVYMVTVLYGHKKQSQHLQSTSPSPKSSSVQRATWTILMIMRFFVVMSILDSNISYSRTVFDDNPIFYCIQILVSHSYATVSPSLFISTEKHVVNFLRFMCERAVNT